MITINGCIRISMIGLPWHFTRHKIHIESQSRQCRFVYVFWLKGWQMIIILGKTSNHYYFINKRISVSGETMRLFAKYDITCCVSKTPNSVACLMRMHAFKAYFNECIQ